MDKKRTVKMIAAFGFVIACGGTYLILYGPFGKSAGIVFEKQPEVQQVLPEATEGDISPVPKEDVAAENHGEEETEKEVEGMLYVHVCGAVSEEGVYVLPEGSRVADGIEAAGGFRKDADAAFHNLAALLEDGQKIYVPTWEETESLSLKERTESTGSSRSGTAGIYGSDVVAKVNLNTAGLTELMTLNGIGEAKAESILKYREKVGRFQSIEELKKVSGIGDAMFERIREDIVVQ